MDDATWDKYSDWMQEGYYWATRKKQNQAYREGIRPRRKVYQEFDYREIMGSLWSNALIQRFYANTVLNVINGVGVT